MSESDVRPLAYVSSPGNSGPESSLEGSDGPLESRTVFKLIMWTALLLTSESVLLCYKVQATHPCLTYHHQERWRRILFEPNKISSLSLKSGREGSVPLAALGCLCSYSSAIRPRGTTLLTIVGYHSASLEVRVRGKLS